MSDCPLADECPSFSERIAGMGCQYYGDRGGAEWCDHYERPIYELKQQPVKPGEEVVVTVEDIHESGAGVGRTEDGFIVFVDGLLPEARAIVRIDQVKGSHARAKKIVERLPLDPDADEAEGETSEESPADPTESKKRSKPKRPEALGSRDNFWGE
ncbi:TRAM domain-containing protein [Haloferax sp. MBLA0076]|uniref:TRAM domain-containing protein n=1 Tax=Haloferax litoreum TaxID=2666140 RepID=A0A6A8GF20_9EURY|nr:MULTISPECIES: TRAM domain-containing protein [Haloferax]KAB1192618.1 TRAM domain-containing protein [Haloferax sp. CBA1148]MRX21092.1 TRAM domain-containing protein [Haloferax litoreum]